VTPTPREGAARGLRAARCLVQTGTDNVIWGYRILLAGRRLYVVQNFLNRK